MKHLKGIRVYQDDLSETFEPSRAIAIDTEAMGLQGGRDRLCLVQISNGDGMCHLVQVGRPAQKAPRLAKVLSDPNVEKIFHFARFDAALLYRTFGILPQPIYCTKIASKLARTYTERHGLKEICRELLSIDLSKSEQSSDWGAAVLSDSQKSYAACDVLYLHLLKSRLDEILKREGRHELFQATCKALICRVLLDSAGYDQDIFAH